MPDTLAIANYRSLLKLTVPLGRHNLLPGPNGSRKSNLYRVLRLLAETAQAGVVPAPARKGRLQATFRAGPETLSRAMQRGEDPIQVQRSTCLSSVRELSRLCRDRAGRNDLSDRHLLMPLFWKRNSGRDIRGDACTPVAGDLEDVSVLIYSQMKAISSLNTQHVVAGEVGPVLLISLTSRVNDSAKADFPGGTCHPFQ